VGKGIQAEPRGTVAAGVVAHGHRFAAAAADDQALQQRGPFPGMLTLNEIAADFDVTPATIKRWQRRGAITGRRIDGRRGKPPGRMKVTEHSGVRWPMMFPQSLVLDALA